MHVRKAAESGWVIWWWIFLSWTQCWELDLLHEQNLVAVAFLGVVLQCDYFLCCYADLDVREISWWPNKYLFLLQGTIEGKNKVQAKKKKLLFTSWRNFVLHITCFWNCDSSRLWNLFLKKPWTLLFLKFPLVVSLKSNRKFSYWYSCDYAQVTVDLF